MPVDDGCKIFVVRGDPASLISIASVGGDTENDFFYTDEHGIYPYIPRKALVCAA
jgi:hypothetical protein